MIRRFLTVMLAMLLWTVQTADAGVDHSTRFNGVVELVQAGGGDETAAGESANSSERAGVCTSGCVCSVFHHALLDEPAKMVRPVENDVVFNTAERVFALFQTTPPTRPPLA